MREMSVDEMREMSQRIVRRERAQQTERARLTRKVQRGGTKHEPGATKAQPPKYKSVRSMARSPAPVIILVIMFFFPHNVYPGCRRQQARFHIALP